MYVSVNLVEFKRLADIAVQLEKLNRRIGVGKDSRNRNVYPVGVRNVSDNGCLHFTFIGLNRKRLLAVDKGWLVMSAYALVLVVAAWFVYRKRLGVGGQ